jgi:hypothetical protein
MNENQTKKISTKFMGHEFETTIVGNFSNLSEEEIEIEFKYYLNKHVQAIVDRTWGAGARALAVGEVDSD